MIKVIKELVFPQKDYAGRVVDDVIHGLAKSTETNFLEWSYIPQYKLYENTMTGMKVFPHEKCRY